MSVILVEEIGSERTATRTSASKREYSVIYQVTTSSRRDGPATILDSVMLPPMYSMYQYGDDFDSDAFLNEISISRTNSPVIWRAQCKYATKVDNPEQNENPLDKPPEFSGAWNRFTAIAESNRNGEPIVNSAKCKFDPPVEMDDNKPSFTVRRNEASIPQTFWTYRKAINSDTVVWAGRTIPPHYLKVNNIRFTQAYFGMMRYFQIEYAFDYTEGQPFVFEGTEENLGFDIAVADMGRLQLVSGELKACIDKAKQPVSDPVPLNSDGTQKSAGTDPDYIAWEVYERKPFSIFNFY